MNAVIWLPDARDDLERLHAFIRPHSRTAAQRAITAVIDAVEQLCEFPEMGRPFDYDLDYREWPVRFGAKNYVIRYRLLEAAIVIVRVWHGLEDR